MLPSFRRPFPGGRVGEINRLCHEWSRTNMLLNSFETLNQAHEDFSEHSRQVRNLDIWIHQIPNCLTQTQCRRDVCDVRQPIDQIVTVRRECPC